MIKTHKTLKQIIVPLAILIIWHVASAAGILNTYIIPPPVEILDTAIILLKKGTLLKHVLVSLCRVFVGFAAAFALAFPTAVLIGMVRGMEDYLNLLLEFIRHIPPIACIPMLILWLGIGEAPKIAVIILATFFPIFLNTLSGIVNCDKKLLEVGDIFGFSMKEKFFKIILPSAMSSVIVGMSLVLVIAGALIGAELIAASSGIGYMIMDAEQLSRPDIIIVGIITIGVLGYIVDLMFFSLTGGLSGGIKIMAGIRIKTLQRPMKYKTVKSVLFQI